MKTLSLISGVIFFLALIPYALAIVGRDWQWRKVKPIAPSTTSWIIWGSLDFITLAGMYVENAVNGQIIGACIGVTVVIGLVLKYGTPGWTRLDKFTLAGAVLGILLWKLFDSPVLGIITSNIVGFAGSIPTFVSAWRKPENENGLAWTMLWVSCVLAVIAIPHWTLADAAQPLTFFVIETIMMGILFIRPRFVRPRLA
jgi:hypothetical protein